MLTLEFARQFTYRYDDRGRYGPYVLVGIVIATIRHDLLALLDTGAERSLLDGQFLRAENIDIFTGRPCRVGGFLGSTTVAYEHPVGLYIDDFELNMPTLFSTQPLERAVLGRDVLGGFCFGLREHLGEIYLSPET